MPGQEDLVLIISSGSSSEESVGLLEINIVKPEDETKFIEKTKVTACSALRHRPFGK